MASVPGSVPTTDAALDSLAPREAFTPGPWSLFASHLRGGRYYTVVIPGCEDPIDLHADENGEANARLIAAAPELYEALKWVMSAHGEQLHDAFDNAHRVIAKAEGRS